MRKLMNNQDRGEGALQLPSTERLDRRRVFFVLAGALSLAAAPRRRLTVMVSGAFSTALARLAPVFTERSGIDLTTVLGASMGETAEAIPNRLARGERADFVILARGPLMRLVADGWVRPGSDVDLVRSAIALAVRSGVPPPPIGSVDQLRKVLLEAKSVAYSDSASGVYVSLELFARLGIAREMAAKAFRVSGRPVGRAIASGEYEIGFQQLSELLPIEGVTIAGLLPAEVQKVTTFSAAIPKSALAVDEARALIAFLKSGRAAPTIRATGLEPAHMEPEV